MEHPALRLRLTPDATAPSTARERLSAISPSLPPKITDDVRLLVSELVTNAVKYAGLGPEEAIDLAVGVRPTRVDVLVRYPEHVGFPPTLPPEPEEAAEPGRTSGWGLFLVDRLSDRWSVVQTQGRIEARFEIDIPRAISS